MNDSYNFMKFDTVGKWYEEKNIVPNFREKAMEIFEDMCLKQHAIMSPFKKFFYELTSTPLTENKGIEFCNYIGMDILIDEDFNGHWLEFNIAPTHGDYNLSHNTGCP